MTTEIIPGIFWIEGPLSVDFLKSHHVKVIIGNKVSKELPELKGFKVIHTSIKDSTHVFKLVSTLYKLYTHNINCAMCFELSKLLPVVIATMICKYCNIKDIDEIDELLHMNYNITLSMQQKNVILELIR